MKRGSKIVLQTLLGILLLAVGSSKLFLTYVPDNPDIMTFPDQFRIFYNAMNATGYFMQLVGSVQLIAGLLLVTQRYAYAGALLHLPVAVNVIALHVCLDKFPEPYFLTGVTMFLINLYLVVIERSRLAPIFNRKPV